MADEERYVFDYKEIVTELIKKKGLHDGIWALYIEFGIAAANMPIEIGKPGEAPKPPTPTDNPAEKLMPTALIPVQKMGIVRTELLSSISVDAAKVNPKPKTKKKA